MKPMLSQQIYDVIVIGGGPSRLFTSNLLAQDGISTVLIEKDSEREEDVVCSGVISKEAFEKYNLPETAIVGALKDAKLYSPGGIHIPYSHPEQAVVVDRYKFDRELGNSAVKSGVEILLDSRVSSIAVRDDYVESQLKTPAGEMSIRSKTAVIATGVSFNLQTYGQTA